MPNLQRMVLTGARVGRPHWLEVRSRGASIPSGVEPARRKFVQGRSYAFCFFALPCHQALMQNYHFRDSFTKVCRQPKASQG